MTAAELPCGSAPPALHFSHFPTRFQAVIWRNWNLVPPAVLAKVLHTGEEQIRAAAADLGLDFHPELLPLWQKRGYLTIIRRNWELLNYEQLLELLEWTPEHLAFILKEEDFLFHKLGLCKPVCPPVRCRELTGEERERTGQIRRLVRAESARAPLTDPPFSFLAGYGKLRPVTGSRYGFGLKMIYSYSALYGDPLLDDELDSYPEGLLADYAACGVNAIWIQATLYTLVPWLGENQPVSRHWQQRQRNLKRLIERTAKYGIKVILYLNEPRSMPEAFFAAHPEWKGAPDEGCNYFALCTGHPEVRAGLAGAVTQLFTEVPGIGGILSITMSENLTHCKSRGGTCPRCDSRSADDLAAEVNNLLYRAMHRADPAAIMLAYNWAWADPAAVVRQLDAGITVLCVSETGIPFETLGCPGEVLDYSISKPGPGAAAGKLWRYALDRGLPTAAKVQINNTWELSAVPYLPVPDLIEEHLRNLQDAGVSALMLSWTLGGYPGGNMELLARSKEEIARRKFGSGAELVLKAWSILSAAFRQFPNNKLATIYFAPQNFGPMTLLFAEPTGRDASMTGFPFDDLETWRGAKGNAAAAPLANPYPPEIYEEAFRRLTEQWREGLTLLDGPVPDGADPAAWQELQDMAAACYCHLRSAYNQICWVRHRNDPAILREERELAAAMLRLVRRDSRLGYEASNHYLYTDSDFLEKILNCDYLLSRIQ